MAGFLYKLFETKMFHSILDIAMDNKLRKLFPYLICFLVAFVTILSCSCITSFVYPKMPLSPYYNDGATFYLLGEGMAKGYTPYVEIFDHKGLYIFYYTAIAGVMGKFGIFVIQVILMTVVEISIYKAMKLFTESWKLVAASMALFSVLYAFSAQTPGDADLELPFVTIMVYFYLRGIKNESFKDLMFGNICAGISAGIALNLRVSDAILPFAFVCFYAYYAISQKKIAYLFRDAGIVLGIIIILTAIPFIHALSGGFFNDMVNAVYLDNLRYIFTAHDRQGGTTIASRLMLATILALFVILMILKNNKLEKKDIIFISVTAGISFLFEFIIAFYLHYLIILFSFIATITFRLIAEYQNRPKVQNISFFTLVAFSIASMLYNPIMYAVNYQTAVNDVAFIDETLTDYDRDGHTLIFTKPALYHEAKVKIGYKDFTAQFNHQLISEACSYDKLLSYLSSSECTYIVSSKGVPFVNQALEDSGATYVEVATSRAVSIVIYHHVA